MQQNPFSTHFHGVNSLHLPRDIWVRFAVPPVASVILSFRQLTPFVLHSFLSNFGNKLPLHGELRFVVHLQCSKQIVKSILMSIEVRRSNNCFPFKNK